ncbi:hypothetical protein QC999_gp08 [Microbacterium phage Cressida]|uniref:Uncharacterized protein n=1 Tax=Microbacterium phage Cressida TaxID=2591216 RepID=A0A514DI11_9CAUD|nr:hypothetical protein QC999_gp08 [Microbacterium phage Cressida]QDH93251.1 hypothetical protein PBI_CRESSIDA_8 [Microbacterium phage Cressida]
MTRRGSLIERVLDRLRHHVYRFGFRPKPGTILYSPSRAWRLYGAEWADGMKRGIDGTAEPLTPEESARAWAMIERAARFYYDDEDEREYPRR